MSEFRPSNEPLINTLLGAPQMTGEQVSNPNRPNITPSPVAVGDAFAVELDRVARGFDVIVSSTSVGAQERAGLASRAIIELAQDVSDAYASAAGLSCRELSSMSQQRPAVTLRAIAVDAAAAGVDLEQFTERLRRIRTSALG